MADTYENLGNVNFTEIDYGKIENPDWQGDDGTSWWIMATLNDVIKKSGWLWGGDKTTLNEAYQGKSGNYCPKKSFIQNTTYNKKTSCLIRGNSEDYGSNRLVRQHDLACGSLTFYLYLSNFTGGTCYDFIVKVGLTNQQSSITTGITSSTTPASVVVKTLTGNIGPGRNMIAYTGKTKPWSRSATINVPDVLDDCTTLSRDCYVFVYVGRSAWGANRSITIEIRNSSNTVIYTRKTDENKDDIRINTGCKWRDFILNNYNIRLSIHANA